MNSLLSVVPYKYNGLWVFDDEAVGLVREPFVSGIDLTIDRLTAQIADAGKGFTLLFSPGPFPQIQAQLKWRREEYGGNWYYCPEYDLEGWLCPALFKYFDEAPPELYAAGQPLR